MHDSPDQYLKVLRQSFARVGLRTMTFPLSAPSGVPASPAAAADTPAGDTAAQPRPGTLHGITIPWPELPDASGLLDYLMRDDVLCWVRREGGLVGFGEAARFSTSSPAPCRQAAAPRCY